MCTPLPPCFLGGVTREIGCAHQLAGVGAFPADDDHPMLTPILEDLSGSTQTEVGDGWRSFSAISYALLSLHCMSSTPNRRHRGAQSVVPRMLSLSVAPSWSRRLSPAMCPQVSFTTLNWSRSRNMMAWRAVVRFGEAQQIAQAVLELAAVQEAGERIVARPPGELPREVRHAARRQ